MDIKREPPKKRGKYIAAGGAIVVLVASTFVLASLPTAAPSVERSTLLIDSVQRGTMIRAVRAPGTLVPERVRFVSALTAGRIERLPLRPGATVTGGSDLLDMSNPVVNVLAIGAAIARAPTLTASFAELLEMSNPDVQLEALEAGRQVTTAEAALVNLETSLATQRLTQKATIASAEATASDAKRQAAMLATLGKQQLASGNDMALANERAVEQTARLSAERERLAVMDGAMARQMALQRSEVQRARAIADFQAWRP